MKVLVAFATRHGATRGIAERIASSLETDGLEVTVRDVGSVDGATLDHFDAFVLGAAAYTGHWLGDMTDFARRNVDLLATRPVYLFSSGPIGADRIDKMGRDVLDLSRPSEFKEFSQSIRPRDVRVFFGAFDPTQTPIGLVEWIGSPFLRLPAVRKAMPTGDFRDWPTIEAWAHGIAAELTSSSQTPEASVVPVGAVS
jgi:menaquinone-dependent protoporphyrinogen oxidase